jgi:hypothetical protein
MLMVIIHRSNYYDVATQSKSTPGKLKDQLDYSKNAAH